MSSSADMLRFVKGDLDACAFLLGVYSIVELWDDLIDRDKVATDADINAAFYTALITLPRNVFYQRNFSLLNPVFEAAILDWYTANRLEKTGVTEHLYTSYGLRRGVQMLIIISARIVGGVSWADDIAFEIGATGDQTWAEYAADFGVK